MEALYRKKNAYNAYTVLQTHFSFQQQDNLTAENNFYLLSKLLQTTKKAFRKCTVG